MTGDRRRPSRPKYTTKRKKPEKKKKRVKLYFYRQDSIKLWKYRLPSKKFLNVILLGGKPDMQTPASRDAFLKKTNIHSVYIPVLISK